MMGMKMEVSKIEYSPPLEGGGRGEGSPKIPTLLDHAKSMRRDATPAEKRLWQGLRSQQQAGIKFRRQHPIGPFIADFFCANAKLVVELDGISHIDSKTDDRRDAWMQERGIRVLRFSNYEALSNPEGVLLATQMACGSPPPPLPQGEGEGLTYTSIPHV
jgi:very-short-patch-repair endonuclease